MKEYLGCVAGHETIDYRFRGESFEESFEDAWARLSAVFPVAVHGESKYLNLDGVTIYGTSGSYVICKRMICNPNRNDWLKITLDNPWRTTLTVTRDHPFPVVGKARLPAELIVAGDMLSMDDGMSYTVFAPVPIEHNGESYDVETESDFFFVSRVMSNNCRTGLGVR